MVFASLDFLLVFLPILLFLYIFIDKKYSNILLLVASLFFYYMGMNSDILLLIGLVLFVYIFGNIIDSFRGKKINKLFLFFSISFIIINLIYFKYFSVFFKKRCLITFRNIFLFFSNDILFSRCISWRRSS